MRSLPRLWRISITGCDELEQIIEEEESYYHLETTANSSAQPLHSSQNIGTPNLCSLFKLDVSDCPKFKWLFTLSTAQTLTSLRELTIERCEGLQYVMKDERAKGKQSIEEAIDDRQAMLLELEHLYLEDLPNLIEVYKRFQFQYVRSHEVVNCPKLVPQQPAVVRTTTKDEN
ncbi:uncharacterized protein LOC129312796 [Prosopis cineraria]|uniref:uncharacterized protein LOC129312796 n=1 Tax=Prosopis cineraria TaxID=364024 RepID=UPI0024108DB8|nr:uncharacterized protein LOC129312796 [Prosopis cineraria]